MPQVRQVKNAVFVHYVWATWDRVPLVVGETRELAYRAIGSRCEELGADVVALGGVADHIHLLVRLPPTVSFAALIKEVKGSSGHLLAKRAMLAGGAFFKWQGSYGVFSVSPHELETVASYIKRQERHHAEQDIIPAWELPTTQAGG